MQGIVRGAGAALVGAIAAAVLCVVPYFGIKRALLEVHWQEVAAWVALVSASTLALGRIYSADAKLRIIMLADNLELSERFARVKPDGETTAGAAPATVTAPLKTKVLSLLHELSRRAPLLGGMLYIYLYNAAIALCLRLQLLLIPDSIILQQTLRLIGLALIVAGTIFQLKAVFSSFASPLRDGEPARFVSVCKIRHPILFGWILVLAGLPLTFGVWMPILAIPGVFVGLNWRLEQKEATLKDQLGDDYIEFQSNTWRLCPLIGQRPRQIGIAD